MCQELPGSEAKRNSSQNVPIGSPIPDNRRRLSQKQERFLAIMVLESQLLKLCGKLILFCLHKPSVQWVVAEMNVSEGPLSGRNSLPGIVHTGQHGVVDDRLEAVQYSLGQWDCHMSHAA